MVKQENSITQVSDSKILLAKMSYYAYVPEAPLLIGTDFSSSGASHCETNADYFIQQVLKL